MTYRLPEIGDKELLQAYIDEHHAHGERSLSASMNLQAMDFMEWVRQIHQNAETGDEKWGRSYTLLCMDKESLIGLLNIRPELPDELRHTLGDIGYGVRPSQRGRGYATEMLGHALDVCRKKGMEQVVLGCYSDNIASQRTILKNGGTLIYESDSYTKDIMSRYYVIRL